MIKCKLWMGKGTNFVTKRMITWIAMCVVVWKQVRVFKLEGDLKILVEWFNGRNELIILHLESWKHKV